MQEQSEMLQSSPQFYQEKEGFSSVTMPTKEPQIRVKCDRPTLLINGGNLSMSERTDQTGEDSRSRAASKASRACYWLFQEKILETLRQQSIQGLLLVASSGRVISREKVLEKPYL